MRCTCVNIGMGTYANQESRMLPFATERYPVAGTKPVGIDRCILPEIERLWALGIETVESCCGHGNDELGYIIVKEPHRDAMADMGYLPREDAPHAFRWPL